MRSAEASWPGGGLGAWAARHSTTRTPWSRPPLSARSSRHAPSRAPARRRPIGTRSLRRSRPPARSVRRTGPVAVALLAFALSAGAGAQRAPAAERPVAARPTIVQRPIPFGAQRRAEMRAYARRHYGIDDFHLRDPKVIVEHYTASDTF